MKVSLAAQLLSRSVADALRYLMTVDDSFSEALPTITFIEKVSMMGNSN